MRFSNALSIIARQISRNGLSNPRGLIFLIGHMRSFSTLLSHLVGTNPDVAGYFEAHQKYRSRLDLVELADKIARAGAHSSNNRYLLDKILHPLPIRDAVLQRGDLKLILMVREPQATIHSIVNNRSGGIGSPDQAAEYYALRLKQIREILDRRRGRALFLEPEALIENSRATLARITDYLGLAVPLTENYEYFPMTGKAKFGDSSEWINHGTIVRNRGGEKVELSANSQFVGLRKDYEVFCRYARINAESVILRQSPVARGIDARPAENS
ncbi:MAG: hypothetical protein NTW45_05890 [Rhodocyclales bacterium]|nr:hypothetical protein [Rhodocyclales bacterium]